MTPLSVELIAAPAALMVLLAMIWFRRHRNARLVSAEAASEDDVDDRFGRFISTGRRSSRKRESIADDAATTGVISVTAVETAATDAPALATAQTELPVDDAVFGPTVPDAEEPDWESMRLPHARQPRDLANETAPEIVAPPAAPAPAAREDELITRPGWPLPGDLEAWESADLAPLPAPTAPEPAFGQWAEVAAARTEQPVDANDHTDGQRTPDPSAERITLGAPYPAPAMAPPASFSGAMEPPTGTIAEPPFTSFEDGVDALGQPAQPVRPSTDPSFWEVGPASEPVAAGPNVPVDAASAQTIETWPPQAPASGESVWATGVPSGESAAPAAVPAPPDAPAPAAAIGADDWWAAESTSAAPEPTAVPDARSLPSTDASGMKRPLVVDTPADGDWWEATAPLQPAADDAWWVTPSAASPFADLAAPAAHTGPQPAAAPAEFVAAAAVATGAAGAQVGSSAPRVLPRLDASAQNRQTAGRFAVGGSAVASGDGAFTRVRFRAPLDRPILGWAIGDGPHHAPGTLVLMVDAVLNCSTAGLSVLQEDTDPARPDGFTLSLSSDGPGPFAVSGSYYVVTE